MTRRLLQGLSLPVLLLGPLLAIAPAQGVSLDQACATYAQKLNDAVASGDSQKAQTVYQQGRERIASRFNGATCPTVKPPAGS